MSSSSNRRKQLPEEGKVALDRLLVDTFEFHGLTLLAVATLFFLAATGFLYSHWGGFTSFEPTFMSNVVESMKVGQLGG
jgi:hypothetical protein